MKQDQFWYCQPAEDWIEALPLGNGRMGAMVYGKPTEEMIQIDESSFWSGARSENHNREDNYQIMWDVRNALLNEDYEEADRIGHEFVGKKNQYGTNMPVGNLKLTLLESGSASSAEEGADRGASLANMESCVEQYERSLSLNQGIARTSFTLNQIPFSREVFVSNPDQVAVIRMKSEQPFSMEIRYDGIGNNTCLAGQIDHEAGCFYRIVGDARETLHSDGNCGVHLEGVAAVVCDGVHRAGEHSIIVEHASDLILYLDLETDMFQEHPEQLARKRAEAAVKKGYEQLRETHIQDVQPLYERMTLTLGNPDMREIPTDERIRRVAEGASDPDLDSLLFAYGRYLLIASSREDSPLPTHMGGIWNDNIYNNIDCTQDMHVDMNLQMQYWAAAQCALPECYTPYFRYLETIVIPSGIKTAQEAYHARGWAAHVVTNPWGFTSLGWSYNWGVFSLGGAWLALLAWDYYTYTNDMEWLNQVGYSILEGAAAFAADYVFWDEKHGLYMTGPSYSPENMFSANGKDYFLSLSTTCDVLLVREILEVYQKAAALTGKGDADLVCRAEEIVKKLPGYQIGKYGQLMEWFEDFEEPIPNHRHTSHLLGVYPFCQIRPWEEPELAKAVKTSIVRRHDEFEITSWGMNMLVGYYGRLGMGNKAYEMIQEVFERIVKPNMASVMSDESSMWCGTWELDGNTGMTSAMAEMLVQSLEGELRLLPALPDAWSEGSLHGICVRGGHTLDMSWEQGRLTEAVLHCGSTGSLHVVYENQMTELSCEAGKSVKIV